jgi:hypothetical protein
MAGVERLFLRAVELIDGLCREGCGRRLGALMGFRVLAGRFEVG